MAVFPQAPVLFNTDSNWTAAQARVEFERWLAATLQLPGAAEAEALTIATGQITPTRASVIVDTEGGTSADDLTTIATTNMHAGAVLMLCAANSGRTVTVKHGTGAGGIALLGGVDCVLSTAHWLMLRRVGDAWVEMPPLRAAQAQQAATAAACTGNAATATLAAAASDMAAGHVLAGKKTAEAVRGAIGVVTPGRGFSAIKSAAQSGIAPATNTKVTFNTEEYDPNGWYDTATSRFIPTETGYYIVSSSLSYSGGVSDANPCQVKIYKNGGNIALGTIAPAGIVQTVPTVTRFVYMNGSTDYLEIYAYAVGPGDKMISADQATFFHAHRV